ncbi:isopentenyl phosphate kinase [Clostridium sp. UBA7503]|uniref:isopentenyl phosphate kinase n=1 Tax=Clostridium sp. UBA7503 TaxID=1946377 RepID=UPI003216B38D
MENIVIIKLGGSLITKKNIPFCINEQHIDNVIKEIKQIYDNCNYKLIIGHGGGSFPHVYAEEYNINKGFVSENSYMGFCKVQNAARKLNSILLDKFIDAGLPVASFQLSDQCIQADSVIKSADMTTLYKMLDYNMIPLVYGDVALDVNKGCSVISTEEIFRFICKDIECRKEFSYYKVNKIILCGVVEGVLTADPNYKKDATLIPVVDASNYGNIGNCLSKAYGFDVTGGMKHKVDTMIKINNGADIRIIDGSHYGNLINAVKGMKIGTLIK